MPTDQDTIIYGTAWENPTLTFIPEGVAEELAEVNRALHQARTWGDLRGALSPERFQEAVDLGPERSDEDDEPIVPGDAEPFSPDQIGAFQDGDWPEFPTQLHERWMPDDVKALGDRVGNMINGDWIEFPTDREERVVEALRAHGYEVRRDDGLVGAACGEGTSRG